MENLGELVENVNDYRIKPKSLIPITNETILNSVTWRTWHFCSNMLHWHSFKPNRVEHKDSGINNGIEFSDNFISSPFH